MAASPSSEHRSFMGSAALASLFPFLLFFLGHYFSLSFVVVDYVAETERNRYYSYSVGSGSVWLSGYRAADAFVAKVMAVAFISYLQLCLVTVATVSASSAAVDPSGRRLTLLESFSKARALWREPSSAARLYFTFLFLGYLLSLLTVLVATLVAVGDALSLGTWHLLVSLLVLFSFLYMGILRSVGPGSLVPAAGEGGHELVAKAPWSTALVLMEEGKLHDFFLFFFSLLVVQSVLLFSMELWNERHYFSVDYFWRDEGFFENAIRSIKPSSVILPLLMSTVWMLGTCRLFRHCAVLLHVC